MFIIQLTSSHCPMSELSKRFFEHKRKCPMKVFEDVVENLDKLGIDYKIELIDGELDLTECFRNEFQKPHQKSLLNFIASTNLSNYPDAVTKLCKDYLKSMCKRNLRDQYVVPVVYSVIIC